MPRFFFFLFAFIFFAQAHAESPSANKMLTAWREKIEEKILEQEPELSRAIIDINSPSNEELENLSPEEWTLDQFSLTPKSKQFQGLLISSSADKRPLPVKGRAEIWVRIPTLSQSLPARAFIKAENIQLTEIPFSRITANTIRDENKLIGKILTRSIMALSALRQQDVKEPILVSRKNLVDVVYQTDHVELRLQAIALEDGKLGDNIRVQNTNSQKIIVGRIAADSTIRMNSPTKSSL